MTNLLMCCGKPPMIIPDVNAAGMQFFTVKCSTCGRHEISGKKDLCVYKFNKAVRSGREGSEEKIKREVRAFCL